MYKDKIERAKKAEERLTILLDGIKEAAPELCEKAGLNNMSQIIHLKESMKIVFDYYSDSHKKAIELPPKYIYKPVGKVDYTNVEDAAAMTEKNWQRLQGIDKCCRKRGGILGRYITVSVGDGQAVYQIVCLSGDAAYARFCDVDGDGYTDIILGKGNWMPLTKAKALIEARDKFNDLWTQKNGEPAYDFRK